MDNDKLVYNGFPRGVIGSSINNGNYIETIDGLAFVSVPTEFVGNVTAQLLVEPSDPANYIIIKGITVIGEGNTGVVKIHDVANKNYLATYFSVNPRGGTSNALNIVLPPGESIYVTSITRGGNDETFVGISYLERSV